MSLLQAIAYFVREAVVNLLRGWKVSLLAVLTIAVSLFLGGSFLLAGRNLGRTVERWRAESRVVIYLKPGASAADLERLAAAARAPAWVEKVDAVSASAARERFRQIFPSLSDVADVSGGEEPLPASLEVRVREGGAARGRLDPWLEGWRRRPEVAMVDDDREWLAQLETIVAVVRGVGLGLGAVLLGAAVFTIGSVIRLTAYLHHEEIAILRLVGATEFYIRGPFYTEGLLQGLIGGSLATAGLYGAWLLAQARAPGALLLEILGAEFLAGRQVLFLVLLGGAAGLAGALASLRGESLRAA